MSLPMDSVLKVASVAEGAGAGFSATDEAGVSTFAAATVGSGLLSGVWVALGVSWAAGVGAGELAGLP
jgi:hypothetical protein